MATTTTHQNPIIHPDRLALVLGDDPDRLERARTDPTSPDWLVWNTFAPAASDPDRLHRVPGVLTAVGGEHMAPPVRLSLFTGRDREPILRPGRASMRHLRTSIEGRGGDEDVLRTHGAPVEVPVRLEGPGALVLVDVAVQSAPLGAGGRDRLVELVEVGLEAAAATRRKLVISIVYPGGTQVAANLSARIARLRDDAHRATALPWRTDTAGVTFRETTWRQVLAAFSHERRHMGVGWQPGRRFLAAAEELGLR